MRKKIDLSEIDGGKHSDLLIHQSTDVKKSTRAGEYSHGRFFPDLKRSYPGNGKSMMFIGFISRLLGRQDDEQNNQQKDAQTNSIRIAQSQSQALMLSLFFMTMFPERQTKALPAPPERKMITLPEWNDTQSDSEDKNEQSLWQMNPSR